MSITVKFVRRSLLILLAGVALVLTLCYSATGVWSAPIAQSSTEPDLAAIDAYIETQMKEFRVPGIAVSIVRDDQIIYSKGFGVADANGRVVTPQTPFIVGSINKPLTAFAIMQLVEQGKVELDAPVQRYIPWFRIADEDASAQITVRHLMLQTSGLATNAGYHYVTNSDTGDQAIEHRVRAMKSYELIHPVGSAFAYSNDSFIVLALIIEQVSGKSYNDYLKQQLFTPLQMVHSSASQPQAVKDGMATGYRHWYGFPVPADMPWNREEIMLYSSSEDLAHYLIAQTNQGRYGAATVLSPQGIAELQRPVTREGTEEVFWGMGWEVSQKFGPPLVYKNGTVSNFYAELIIMPESHYSVVFLANASRTLASYFGDRPLRATAISVAKLLAGEEPIVVTSPIPLVIYGALLLIVIVQLVLLVYSIVRLQQWQRDPEQRPHGLAAYVRRVVLPFLISVAWAILMWIGVPQFFGVSLQYLTYGVPDIGYTALLSGVIALGWGIVNAILATLIMQKDVLKSPMPTILENSSASGLQGVK